MWGFIRKQKYSKENSQGSNRERRKMRQKSTPVKRAGQSIVAANKRKKETREDTPYQPPKKLSRLNREALGDELEEITEEFYEEEEAQKQDEGLPTSIEEEEFWESDKHTKAQWAAEARRYKIPICTKSLRLACPAKECIEKGNEMIPAYISCKSRQGGNYIAMMFTCNYCSAFAPTKEDAQKCNVFAGHIVSKFAQNYLRRARDCGIDDISTIPLPDGSPVETNNQTDNILNKASDRLPNIQDTIKSMSQKIDEVYSIIIERKGMMCGTCKDQTFEEVQRKGILKKLADEIRKEASEMTCGPCRDQTFEKVELSEELLEEQPATQVDDVDD